MGYEERVYEGGKFATVEVTGKPYDEAVKEAVLKLLKYVGGSNDQGKNPYSQKLAVSWGCPSCLSVGGRVGFREETGVWGNRSAFNRISRSI